MQLFIKHKKAIKQALKESLEKDARYYQQMKPVAHAYTLMYECSLQKAVYEVML